MGHRHPAVTGDVDTSPISWLAPKHIPAGDKGAEGGRLKGARSVGEERGKCLGTIPKFTKAMSQCIMDAFCQKTSPRFSAEPSAHLTGPLGLCAP